MDRNGIGRIPSVSDGATFARRLPFMAHGCRRSYAVDRSVTLTIDGTRQRLRICASREELPPLLIVQAGPGLPLLNEAAKFQRRLNLEQDFTVAYWDQRGCGPAPSGDARSASLETQVSDLRYIVRWLARETAQRPIVMGISMGATLALLAARSEPWDIRAMVAVSMDIDTRASDASALAFLKNMVAARANRKMARLVDRLSSPPYTDPSLFQLRARLLTDLGAIEHGKRFGELLGELLRGFLCAYGGFGAVAAIRNMNTVQRRLLPEAGAIDLLANWVQPEVPVHTSSANATPWSRLP